MSKKNIPFGVLIIFAVSLLTLVAVGQSTDAWVGTWNLNVAKSQFPPGRRTPRSNTWTIASPNGGWMSVADIISADGTTMHEEVNSKFDGHDYPVKGTGPNQAAHANRTVAHTRIDDHTFEVVVKLNGKLANTRRFVVSQDGKTLTDTGTGTDPQRRKVVSVQIWDRQ
jgi:hypothetical protein